ncbi:MAG: transposase [Gemmatimonadota bacterium]
MSEVCRRHGIDGTTYYNWEKRACTAATLGSPL